MNGKELKKNAKTLPFGARELAKKMNISTGTLYDLYKRESIEIKYLEKFSKASKIPLSELDESFKNQNKIETSNIVEVLKFENERLKQENTEIKQENSFLSNKIKQLEAKFDQLNDALYKKFLGLEMGKRKASSTQKTTLSKKFVYSN